MPLVAYDGPPALRVEQDWATLGIGKIDRAYSPAPVTRRWFLHDVEVTEDEFAAAALRFFRRLVPGGAW